MLVSSQNVLNERHTTGTTVMIVPPADAVVIHENIPGAQPDGQGGFTVPCTTNATVALTYASQMFTIDPRDLAVEPVDPNNPGGSCVSGIASGESSNNQKEWLVSCLLCSFFSSFICDKLIYYLSFFFCI